LTANTIGTNELAGDLNRILRKLTTLPGRHSSGEDSMKHFIPSPQDQGNLICHVPYPYNLASLNMHNNRRTHNLLYPSHVPMGELEGKNYAKIIGAETKSSSGAEHVAILSNRDEPKKPKKKRAQRDPTNSEFNCDQCPYKSAYKENVVKHFKIKHSQIKDIH